MISVRMFTVLATMVALVLGLAAQCATEAPSISAPTPTPTPKPVAEPEIEEEPPPASIGDLVWYDADQDGIQDVPEVVGIQGVAVELYRSDDTLAESTTTDQDGSYLFSSMDAGNYYVKFILPRGFLFSPQDEGDDDSVDSDADPTTGETTLITLDPGETDLTWDAGMYHLEIVGMLEFPDEENDGINFNTGESAGPLPEQIDITGAYWLSDTEILDTSWFTPTTEISGTDGLFSLEFDRVPQLTEEMYAAFGKYHWGSPIFGQQIEEVSQDGWYLDTIANGYVIFHVLPPYTVETYVRFVDDGEWTTVPVDLWAMLDRNRIIAILAPDPIVAVWPGYQPPSQDIGWFAIAWDPTYENVDVVWGSDDGLGIPVPPPSPVKPECSSNQDCEAIYGPGWECTGGHASARQCQEPEEGALSGIQPELEPLLREFEEEYNAAFKSVDPERLWKLIHPLANDLYHYSRCQDYAKEVIGNRVSIKIRSATERAVWLWPAEGYPVRVEDAFECEAEFTAGGQTTLMKFHLGLVDGSLYFFTRCGELVPPTEPEEPADPAPAGPHISNPYPPDAGMGHCCIGLNCEGLPTEIPYSVTVDSSATVEFLWVPPGADQPEQKGGDFVRGEGNEWYFTLIPPAWVVVGDFTYSIRATNSAGHESLWEGGTGLFFER